MSSRQNVASVGWRPFLGFVCKKLMPMVCRIHSLVRLLHLLLSFGIVLIMIYTQSALYHDVVNDQKVFYALAYFTLFTLALIFYFLTCFSDPGFVPINRKTDSLDEEPLVQQVPFRECGFCGIIQPIRSYHCEDCGRCVSRFDHHCPWMDRCIGELNHKYFFVFLILETWLIAWTLVIMFRSTKSQSTLAEFIVSNGVYIIIIVILLCGGLVCGILLLVHTYLLCVNSTTWEYVSREKITYLKYLDHDTDPFKQSCARNFINFCSCTQTDWSKIYVKNGLSEGWMQ